MNKILSTSLIRNFVFGVEDSLVSTAGLLSGIAAVSIPREHIILTGVVLVFVEAFSMGIGSFLSGHSAEDYERQAETPVVHQILPGLTMFFSYFISGFVPLAPYFFLEISQAFIVSIVLSLVALFFLGVVSAEVAHTKIWRNSLQMLLVGGLAIILGVIIGKLIS